MLLLLVIGSQLLVLPRTVISTTAYARNRLDVYNLVMASELVFRVVAMVFLFWAIGPSLVAAGMSFVVATVLALLVSIVLWVREQPRVQIRAALFSWSIFHKMSQTSQWTILNQVGSILFLAIDLVVVNVVLGAEVAGLYGTVVVWATFLRALGVALSGVITPVALRRMAVAGVKGLVSPISRSIRLMGLAMALPVGLVCGLAAPILNVWLGPEFTRMAPVMIALTFHLTLNVAVTPLFAVQLAADRVRVPGLVTLFMGLVNAIVAFAVAGVDGRGLGVALAGATVLTVKNALFTPLYAARITSERVSTYWGSVVPGLILTGLVTLAAWSAQNLIAFGSVVDLLVGTVAGGAVYLLGMLWFGLRSGDREALARMIGKGNG
jgi:membrane protein EpsK